MNTNNEHATNATAMINTPKLSLYHPNPKGTGAALHLELRPANGIANKDGAIFGCIARQNAVGDGKTSFPRFDYDKRITFKLDFTDVCKFIQVFRGECESIDDGRGIYHRLHDGGELISLRHDVEPYSSYALEVTKLTNGTDADQTALLFLTPAEALGLCEVFTASLKEIAFGTGFEATSAALGFAQEDK